MLEDNHYSHNIKALVYEKGSHFIGCAEVPKKLMKIMFPNEKRYPQECSEARKDSQKRTGNENRIRVSATFHIIRETA